MLELVRELLDLLMQLQFCGSWLLHRCAHGTQNLEWGGGWSRYAVLAAQQRKDVCAPRVSLVFAPRALCAE